MSTAPNPPEGSRDARDEPGRQQQPPRGSIFAVPAPIKRLFDKFPLRTYPANELPLRAPRHRDENVLYVFTTDEGVRNGAPSFNPSCLKWQTYLKFSGIQFRTEASSNHASPSGALPFLLPAVTTGDTTKAVPRVPSAKLQRWCMSNSPSSIEEPGDLRYEAYLSLLDHRIRRAWLYTVYLSPHNFPSLAEPLYILPTSSSAFVRLTTAHTLRRAAEAELLKFSAVINVERLYKDADEAFDALEMLLGQNTWFFGAERPGLFDASVFAYSHLLLDEGLGKGWVDTRLRDMVIRRTGLVMHRERILREYFQASPSSYELSGEQDA
ncbi:uncharacterized protein EI97DRAFT_467062 [Westerdykella ornata]|uniref:Mitochondrial outer membrane protein n=1 Tax=Westerdykella ornata TaxID=318751 RepID=A0A6A6JIT4_WESOR|nr:uncharacterized protein EI97DRAFT_467062 [Westerdykella ornata]KAF2276352.1 hypothetical protein EI97DRAFT_467062 [Westerdykella ornata]